MGVSVGAGVSVGNKGVDVSGSTLGVGVATVGVVIGSIGVLVFRDWVVIGGMGVSVGVGREKSRIPEIPKKAATATITPIIAAIV